MSLTLTIDQGNSSAKLVVWDGSALVDQDELKELHPEQLRSIAERFRPERALCCSVTGNGKRISRYLQECGVEAREVSFDMPLPLQLDYATPHTLGEDRIAAAVGAWSLFPGRNSLVVDMGTAVTYDVVSADGHFRGGNIAPGIGMRLRSLHSFTARLPEVGGYGDTPLFGIDTATAMRAGAVRGVMAEIGYYRSQLGPDTGIVLTGGWARHVSEYLDFEVTVDPCLVTKGLLSILLYNENK
jgi:type III pantothenate kinase